MGGRERERERERAADYTLYTTSTTYSFLHVPSSLSGTYEVDNNWIITSNSD